MDTKTISARNLQSLLVLIITCGSLISGTFNLMQDSWIAVLMMGVIFLPVILIYCRICSLLPGKGLFDIIEHLFGHYGGMVFTILMTMYTVITSGFVLEHYTEFTVIISLEETPKLPIIIVLALSVLYLAHKGVNVLGRWSLIIFILIIANFILTLLFSMSIMEPSYIMPVFDHKLTDILSNSSAVGSVAIGETVFVLALFGHVKKSDSPYKIYIPSLIIGVVIFSTIILRNLFVLGPDLERAAEFSTYMTVRIIKIGTFFERMESTISFVYILFGITKLTLLLSAAAMGSAKLFKSADYRKFLTPCCLLMIAVATIVFKSVMEMYDFVWVYRIISIPFQIIIPMIIWITAEFKNRKKLSSTQ